MSRISLVIAVMLLTGACGGDAASVQPAATRVPSTPVVLPSATPTVVPAMSAVDLERALITRDDLDRLWYGSSAAFPVFVPSETCALAQSFVSYGALASATRTLSQSEGGPWLTEMLLLYPDRQVASDAFGALREEFACSVWTQQSPLAPAQAQAATAAPAGSPTPQPAGTVPAEPAQPVWDTLAPSDLNYRAGAFLAGLESRMQPQIEVEFVAVRDNNLILVIAHWSPFEIDTDITLSFVDLALERLDAALE